MFNFFATVGRKPWAPSVMPLVGFTTITGYLGFHTFGHSLIRDLLGAQSQSGKREEISKKLEMLILSVYEDIKDVFNQPILEHPLLKVNNKAEIKWFSSSTLDPVTFGLSESKTGIVIGVPSHYNYDKPDDLPSSLFQIRRVKLFKFPAQDIEGEKSSEMDADCENCESGTKIGIERKSEQGKEYIESLLLSENAKKFSIARELFIGDSYKPLIVSCAMLGSFLLGISLARGSVLKLGYKDAHITQRIPFYIVSGIGGYGTYKLTSRVVDDFYQERTKERAIALGEAYREGAEEYYAKLELRNKILDVRRLTE